MSRRRLPNPGYIFRPSECPNLPHPKPMEGKCGLCGCDVRAFRLGMILAPIVTGMAAGLVVALIAGAVVAIWKVAL